MLAARRMKKLWRRPWRLTAVQHLSAQQEDARIPRPWLQTLVLSWMPGSARQQVRCALTSPRPPVMPAQAARPAAGNSRRPGIQ